MSSATDYKVAVFAAEAACPKCGLDSCDGSCPEPVIPPEFSDHALALEAVRRHGEDLRYVNAWGRWFTWAGSVWRHDETLSVYDLARKVCRDASLTVPPSRPAIATKIASAQTVAAIIRLAQSDRVVARDVTVWDRDPSLLNTPGGVVDLSTGELHPHCRHDHMTKLTAVAPGGDCPLWLAFLSRVTGNDGELVAFLQRMAGVCLDRLDS